MHTAPSGGDLPTERSFGLFFGVLFLAAATYLLWLNHPWPAIPVGLGGVGLLVSAFAAPRLLAPLNVAWARLGMLLARIFNPLVMGALFFLVITPYALVIRLMRRDALRLRAEPASDSYWIEREDAGPDTESFKRQY